MVASFRNEELRGSRRSELLPHRLLVEVRRLVPRPVRVDDQHGRANVRQRLKRIGLRDRRPLGFERVAKAALRSVPSGSGASSIRSLRSSHRFHSLSAISRPQRPWYSSNSLNRCSSEAPNAATTTEALSMNARSPTTASKRTSPPTSSPAAAATKVAIAPPSG